MTRAVDQSSHAQQDAMIDWGGKARRAGAGSVLRDYRLNKAARQFVAISFFQTTSRCYLRA